MAKAPVAARPSVPPVKSRVLDRSKSFGTVHPPDNNLHFTQNGFYFDREGVHVPLPGDPKGPVRPTMAPARAAPAAVEAEAIEDEDTPADEREGHIVGEVDLAAWALGTEKYVFGKVMKAFRDGFSMNISNEIDGLTFLIDQGVVSAEQVAAARGGDWADRA